MKSWIAEVIGKMHINKIKQSELAERIGIRRDYLNKILNGREEPRDAKERIIAAVDDIVAERTRVC